MKRIGLWVVMLLGIWGVQASHADGSTLPHDFHVCITQIDYQPNRNTLEITIKIFTDDLEGTLENLGAPRLNIGHSTLEHAMTDSLIKSYFHNRFKINAPKQGLTLDWIGKEVELDATWCYFECKMLPGQKEIEVFNRILIERFDDQMNIIHFKGGNRTQSIVFDLNKSRETIQIQ